MPIGEWPPKAPDRIYGVRITEHLVSTGAPDSDSITLNTSDYFEMATLDADLEQFVKNVVPFDTSAMLMKRGIVAPLPGGEGKPAWEQKFPSMIGVQYLPRLLTTMRDTSVQGLFHALLAEAADPAMVQTRRHFQALAEFFEDEMLEYGLSMLVRAAHFDGELDRAKAYVVRAMARIAADESIELGIRNERVNKIRVLLDDFD